MNRLGRSAVLVLLGAFTARMIWSGDFGWFVQQRMRYPLLAAAVALIGLGVFEMLRGSREESKDPESTRLFVAPRVGLMLVLPFLVLTSVSPSGLGASAADRVEAFTPAQPTSEFEPLEDTSEPIEMRVFEFLHRAVWDDERSLENRTIRLEGLVVNDPSVPDGFKLTRFLVSCCAADGIPLQVAVHGTPPLEDDTWVVADVVWRLPDRPYQETEGGGVVEADVVDIQVITDAPKDAYESPY